MLTLEFVFVLAAEIIQVLDSIAWVRCASGNVFNPTLHLTYKAQIGKRPLSLHKGGKMQ